MNNKKSGTWVILLSLAITFILTLLPFPEGFNHYQPNWTFLVLSYWAMALPHRVGLLWAFVCGLFLDSLIGVTLGIHSFALILMVFILKSQYKRLRLFPAWKQGLVVFGLSLVYAGILFWLARLNAKPEYEFTWGNALVNGLIWPWLMMLLRNIRRYFNVN